MGEKMITMPQGFNIDSPIKVIKVNEKGKISLDVDALSSVLLQESVRNTPVVVISIAGDSRTGKSFIMNFIVRALTYGYDHWMPDDNIPLKGFSWKPGSERHTTGIHLWSQPFTVNLKNGKNVAIILMDTQGAHYCASTAREDATVFALSTMTSSIQVYNLMRNIKENDLQQLSFITMYSNLVVNDSLEQPFQKLVFLVRDWCFPYENEYGYDGGQKLMNKLFNVDNNMHSELQNIREQITSCFNEIECFLMPHPGREVDSSPSFKGNLSDIEPEFIKIMKLFVSSLLDPKNLLVKKIGGLEMTGNLLFEYFRTFHEILSRDTFETVNHLLETTANANNLSAMEAAEEYYIKMMENICRANQSYLNIKLLESMHFYHRSIALEQFDNDSRLGGLDYSKNYRNKLITQIDESFEHFQVQNNSKKTWLQNLLTLIEK